MTTGNNVGHNETCILKGKVVSLERINMDNAAADRCRRNNYGITYKYEPDTLPLCIDVNRFNDAECKNEKEVYALQYAVKCLNALTYGPEDTSILDEYANDTLLTFDYNTGNTLFDDDAFQRDLNEYKNKQKALVEEHNKIVATTTLVNAIENAKKLQQIKNEVAELRTKQPDKSDAKYNHPEIVKGTTSVKQALDRYKELCELRDKCEQEWGQLVMDYKHSHAGKLTISEDTFRIVKELDKEGIRLTGDTEKLYNAITRYESVEDYNENNWKDVSSFDGRDESRKFLTQKQFKLWRKYGIYIPSYYGPAVIDWMMYDHFNANDLMWLNALKAFYERVTALKRIEEQSK